MLTLAETHAELGENDPYHARQARLWYQQAAQQGNATAQYELARIYRYDWGARVTSARCCAGTGRRR